MIEPAAVLPGYGPIANLIEDLSEKVKVLA
jgi:hypothetical protein